MTESVFCLNPLGWTPWTLRFYQAVMTRCIPIIIADNIEFPFESEINYSEFALKIPEKDVSDILETMRDMPEEERERRRRYMDKIWKQFTYQRPAEKTRLLHRERVGQKNPRAQEIRSRKLLVTLTTIDESVFNEPVVLHASFVLNTTEEREEREGEK